MTNENIEKDTLETEAEKPEEKSKSGDNPSETEESQETLTHKELTEAEFKAMEAQKKAAQEKLEKAKRELEALKSKPAPAAAPGGVNSAMEAIRLGAALRDYTPEEVEFITRNASDESIDGIINASKDEWVQTAIQAKREKVEKEKSTPEPSSRQGSAVGTKPLSEMSLDEKAEWLAEQGFVRPFPKAKPL